MLDNERVLQLPFKQLQTVQRAAAGSSGFEAAGVQCTEAAEFNRCHEVELMGWGEMPRACIAEPIEKQGEAYLQLNLPDGLSGRQEPSGHHEQTDTQI